MENDGFWRTVWRPRSIINDKRTGSGSKWFLFIESLWGLMNMSRSRADGTTSSWLLYFRNFTNFHTVSYIIWTPLWTKCASAAAILFNISADVIRYNYLLMSSWCKFYLYQFAHSSPGFIYNTAVEKQIFSLVHQTLSTNIKNKRSNTYS